MPPHGKIEAALAEIARLANEPGAHDSKVPVLLAWTTTFVVLSSLFLLARTYSRAVLLKKWLLEDNILLTAWLFAVAHYILLCFTTRYGAGRHIWTLGLSQLIIFTKLEIALTMVFLWGIGVIKLGICVFYLRIFERNWTIIACVVFVAITHFGSPLIILFACRPISAIWDITTFMSGGDDPTCIDLGIPAYLVSVASVVADIWIMVVTLPSIFRLHLPWRQKAILLAIMSLGIFAIAASIYRAVRFRQALLETDTTWASMNVNIASSLEFNVALICASAPCLRPLLRKISPNFSSWLSLSASRTVALEDSANHQPGGSIRTPDETSKYGSMSTAMTKMDDDGQLGSDGKASGQCGDVNSGLDSGATELRVQERI